MIFPQNGNQLNKFFRPHSSMDRMSDSGSDDLGSNPGGVTKKTKACAI